MWHLWCPYLLLSSSSFGASGGPCFVIVAFPGYLHFYLPGHIEWPDNRSWLPARYFVEIHYYRVLAIQAVYNRSWRIPARYFIAFHDCIFLLGK